MPAAAQTAPTNPAIPTATPTRYIGPSVVCSFRSPARTNARNGGLVACNRKTGSSTGLAIHFGMRSCPNGWVESYRSTGKERDSETGLDFFGARYMSSAQGRWSSPDVVNITNARLLSPSNTLNKYIYGGNNPLKFVDPDGRDITIFYTDEGPAGHWMMAASNPDTGDFGFRSFGPTDHSVLTMTKQAAGVAVPGTEAYALPSSADDLRQNYSSLTIQTTPEVAQAAINAIRSTGSSTYTLYLNNCTTACEAALREAGIHLSDLTPKEAWENLYARYSKEGLALKDAWYYGFWQLSRAYSLIPGISAAPHQHGIDYGNSRYGMNPFDFVTLQLKSMLGCTETWNASTNTLNCH